MNKPQTVVNLHEAKARLSELVAAAAAGEEICIARAGKPLARLVPLAKAEPRQAGIAKLKGRLDDAFFEPLADEELVAWAQ